LYAGFQARLARSAVTEPGRERRGCTGTPALILSSAHRRSIGRRGTHERQARCPRRPEGVRKQLLRASSSTTSASRTSTSRPTRRQCPVTKLQAPRRYTWVGGGPGYTATGFRGLLVVEACSRRSTTPSSAGRAGAVPGALLCTVLGLGPRNGAGPAERLGRKPWRRKLGRSWGTGAPGFPGSTPKGGHLPTKRWWTAVCPRITLVPLGQSEENSAFWQTGRGSRGTTSFLHGSYAGAKVPRKSWPGGPKAP